MYLHICKIVNPLHALFKDYLTVYLFFKNRFAITLGSIGDYESTQEKIKNGYIFKVNLKLAKEFNYYVIQSQVIVLFSSNHLVILQWSNSL